MRATGLGDCVIHPSLTGADFDLDFIDDCTENRVVSLCLLVRLLAHFRCLVASCFANLPTLSLRYNRHW